MTRQAPEDACQEAGGEEPRLSPRAAFVVQLAGETSIDEGLVVGRVEHLSSGTSEPFGSLEELLRFMKRLGFIREKVASRPS
jgi:hypothetical protein